MGGEGADTLRRGSPIPTASYDKNWHPTWNLAYIVSRRSCLTVSLIVAPCCAVVIPLKGVCSYPWKSLKKLEIDLQQIGIIERQPVQADKQDHDG